MAGTGCIRQRTNAIKDQIAAEADVSPRTFFHYFPSKEDVVLEEFEIRLARLTELLSVQAGKERPSTTIRNALLAVAKDYEAESEQIMLRVKLTLASPTVRAGSLELQARWEDKIAATFAASLGVDTDEDPRPRILAAITLGAMRIAQRRWVAGGGRARLPDLITETLDVLDRGAGYLDGNTGASG